MTRGLFATMLERADTKEAIGLNRSRLRSTRPVRKAEPRRTVAGSVGVQSGVGGIHGFVFMPQMREGQLQAFYAPKVWFTVFVFAPMTLTIL